MLPIQQRARRVPGRAVALVAPPASDRRERLEDHPVGEGGGDVGVVVGRTDLHHVDPDDGQLEADPAYGVEQLARRQPAGLRRPGPGRVAGVADVDVDGEEDALALDRKSVV